MTFPSFRGLWTAITAVFALQLALPVPDAEAGLFDKLREKRRAKMAKNQAPAPKPKPKPRYRSWYRDEHKDAYINQELLEGEPEAERKIIIDIGRQRAFLVVNGLVAIDSAVSTARRGKFTPRGTWTITEKIKSGKVSTLYNVYMPNWMRLGTSAIGMHTGDLPGYPASAGCIRLPQSVAPVFYEHASRGTEVDVVDSWEEEELIVPYTFSKSVLVAGV